MSNSYKTIAKTSGIIGVVQIIKMLFGVVQNKVLALVIGTEGFGVWGLYNSFLEMINSFSTLGVEASGVREIARAKNKKHAMQTIWIVKQVVFFSALIVCIGIILFAKKISSFIFGNENYYIGFIIISVAVFFNGLVKSNISILNGLRLIKSLAFSQIIGFVFGSIFVIISVLIFKQKIIPFLFVISVLCLFFSTSFFIKRSFLIPSAPAKKEIFFNVKKLVYLGLGFTISAIIGSLMSFFSRKYLVDSFDLSTVGIYQSCWTISNLYVGTILTAMGVDFMPRLMKVIGDRDTSNRMISEQLEFSVLLSSIGIIFMLIFSPYILSFLYSEDFEIGSVLIRYQTLGVSLRVFGFVFGYVIMAYNKPILFVLTQSIVFVLDYVFLILLSELFGFDGLGLNYFFSYLIYVFVTYFLCRKYFSIKLSRRLKKILFLEWVVIFISSMIVLLFDSFMLVFSGLVLCICYSFLVNYILKKYMHIDFFQLVKSKITNGK